jgi:putative PIN family toxin of toxin-antitoxin system
MKAVFDTSVVVSALRSERGASNRLLALAWLKSFEILATPALFLEYEEVIQRDEHVAVHRFSAERMHDFLVGLAAIIVPVRVYYQWRPQVQDVDDEMVLESALNGRADVIVTHNVRDFQHAASKFRLRVVTPAEFLSEVEK